MFKQRLLTTLVLVPLVLWAIYCANVWWLGAIVLLLLMACGWEWSQLVPFRQTVWKGLFTLALLPLAWLSVHWFHGWLLCGLLFWCAVLMAVLTFPASQLCWGHRVWVSGAGLLLLPLFASGLAALYHRADGKHFIVYLLCIVWAADIGAYLAGKRWGHRKLIAKVSPGKTVEGAAGGFVFVLLVASIGVIFFHPKSLIAWYVVAISTALISIFGDLFISMLKRRCHLKDTGQLIPGHGGVLDRLDSLIAALPWFYFMLSFLTMGG